MVIQKNIFLSTYIYLVYFSVIRIDDANLLQNSINFKDCVVASIESDYLGYFPKII